MVPDTNSQIHAPTPSTAIGITGGAMRGRTAKATINNTNPEKKKTGSKLLPRPAPDTGATSQA